MAVARNTTALPVKRSATMPRCGSAEKVIITDCAGLCSSACCQRGSIAPTRVAVMKPLTLGVSMAARSHGLSDALAAARGHAAASGGFTTTLVLAEAGITRASAGIRGRRAPIGRARAASGVAVRVA